MKKVLALFLSAAMTAGLLAGCGESNTASSDTPETAAATTAAAATAAVSETPMDTSVSEASAETSAEDSAAEETHPTLSYPVGDGTTTFLMLNVYNPNASAVYGNDGDYTSAYTYKTLAEATGVNVEFKMLAEATFSTQIDLIIASGDTPDLYGRSLGSYDSKLMQAISDDVVIDINPLVEENAPDLYALMQSDSYWKSQLTNQDGTICKIAGYTIPKTTSGPFIRGDWLDELNLDVPTNLDELTTTLEAFKNKYNCSLSLLLDSDLGSCLDQLFNFTAMGFNDFSFQQTEPNSHKLICSLSSDDYIKYLLTLNDYYKKGIITSDFLSTSKNAGNLEACYIGGSSGVWKDDAKYTYNNAASAQEENPSWEAVPFTFDMSDYHMTETTTGGGVGMTQCYISANCEDPELALQFLNYGFTDEGALLVQAGVKDLTYTVDSSGKMSYTDVITNNPDGYTSSQATYVYLTDAWMPTRQLPEVFAMAYTQEVMDAYDTWTDADMGDDTMVFPRECTLTADEQSEVFSLKSDALTLFSENASKVILGDLDEAGYRDVIAQANATGLDRITEIYQGAYDRYLAEQ